MGFRKHLAGEGQAWHNFNLPGNQYNIHVYVILMSRIVVTYHIFSLILE